MVRGYEDIKLRNVERFRERAEPLRERLRFAARALRSLSGMDSTFTIGGDLEVRRLGFGAMRITGDGIWGPPDDPESAKARAAPRASSSGVNLIDTADSYGPEVSENLIAEALHPYPEGLVIATKGGLRRTGPGEWPRDARPERLKECCEGSLRRLRLDRIDLYQLHAPDPKVPLEDSLGALKELQDEGKIRHIGVSNVSVEELERARALVDVVTVQNRYNLVDRHSEDVLDACDAAGIGFIPWFPLATGELARPGGPLDELARAHDATPGQVALAWLLARSPVMLPIPGTASEQHLEENVAAGELRARAPGARAPRRTPPDCTCSEGVNEPSCHARSAPRAWTTSPSGWTSAQALAIVPVRPPRHARDRADGHVHARRRRRAQLGKLTLFDADGPRERGRARARSCCACGDLERRSRGCPHARSSAEDGVARFDAARGAAARPRRARRRRLRPRPRRAARARRATPRRRRSPGSASSATDGGARR